MTIDGGSYTTDSSQLEISAYYIEGSHYIIQPNDKTEAITNGSKDSYLPIANVSRIMKNAIPQKEKIAKDAKKCVQEWTHRRFITSEASEGCHQEKWKPINGEDILFAMSILGFDSYAGLLKLYLWKFREAMEGEKGIGRTVTATGELSEAPTEEAFTNYLSSHLITA